MKEITEKQKCIAEQAVYGDLKIYDTETKEIGKCGFVELKVALGSSYIKPILRPLSWLTREIMHEGVNGGEPFVPLVEFSKKNFIGTPKDETDFILQNGDYGYGVYFNYETYRGRKRRFFLQVYKDGCLQAFSTDIKSNSYKSNTAKYSVIHARCILDILNQWHFDIRNLLSTGDAVSTEEVGDVYAIKSFDDILEENKDVLIRLKENGD